MSDDLETILVFQREHSNRLEEWVSPHDNVNFSFDHGDVGVYGRADGKHLVYFAHLVEAHLIQRPKPVDISD